MAIILDFWDRIEATKKPKRYSDQEIIFQLEVVQLNKKQTLIKDKNEQIKYTSVGCGNENRMGN